MENEASEKRTNALFVCTALVNHLKMASVATRSQFSPEKCIPQHRSLTPNAR